MRRDGRPEWLVLLLAACAGAGAGGGAPPGGSGDGGGSDAGGAADGGSVPPRVLHYIRGEPFARLVIEVDAVASARPRAAVEEDLVQRLGAVLDKPGGVAVTEDGEVASRGTDHAWTSAELDALAEETFDLAVPAAAVKMHALFIDGRSADDSGGARVLGLAWAHTHLVVFKQSLEETCAGAGVGALLREELCAAAELGVWTHEAGHLIGLVDNGLPMVADHRDPEHGPHDASDACVMYWAYEGSGLVDALAARLLGGEGAAPDFDPACRDDLAALR